MRLVTTKKLYRAFRELDPFTDRECELFVRRVKNATGRMVAVRVTTILAALVMVPLSVAAIPFLNATLYAPLEHQLGWRAADVLTMALWIAWPVAVPALVGLLIRDLIMRSLLRNAIQVRIERIQCPECRYRLLGQTVVNDHVRCPECGTTVPLRVLGVDSAEDLLPQDLP